MALLGGYKMDRKLNVIVPGHKGSWYEIDHKQILGKPYFLMEHEQEGQDVPNIIIDEDNNLIMDNIYNGFSDFTYALEEVEEHQQTTCDYLEKQLGEGWQVKFNEGNRSIRQGFYATYSRHTLSTKHTYIYFSLIYFEDKNKWKVFDIEAEEIAYGSWYDLDQEEVQEYKELIQDKLNGPII